MSPDLLHRECPDQTDSHRDFYSAPAELRNPMNDQYPYAISIYFPPRHILFIPIPNANSRPQKKKKVS